MLQATLPEGIQFIFSGILFFPIAFIVASMLAGLPYDALFVWTMSHPYDQIMSLKNDEKYDFLTKSSYFVVGINNILGFAFSIYGALYLLNKTYTMGYVEGVLWKLMGSWGIMQAL